MIMPFKNEEDRRRYMREYKNKNRDAIIARRREIYAAQVVRRDGWSTGNVCRSCGGKPENKPRPNCTENRHAAIYANRRKSNNEYRRERRQLARERGTVERTGRGNPETKRAYQKKMNADLRAAIMARLNQFACVRCGFSDPRALQFDHINGGGRRHRQQVGSAAKFLRALLALTSKELTAEFQVLCANCNFIKREENNEYHARTIAEETN